MKKTIILALLCVIAQGALAQTYYECSWDDVKKQVVRTELTASGNIDDISSAKYAQGGNLIGKQADGSGYDYFVVTKSCKIKNGLTVSGHCKLILCDGVEVTVGTTGSVQALDGEGHGIEVPEGSTFEIYAQSTGDSKGKLKVLPFITIDGNAGIGSKAGKNPGAIRIHGGYIECRGENKAASIGGGDGGRGADIIIYDGVVKAINYYHANRSGGSEGPEGSGDPYGMTGIGAGYLNGDAGSIVIYGGDVYAEGGPKGAGIGCARGPDTNSTTERSTCSGSVTIHGGTVTAEGGWLGAGIGCAQWAKGITVTINGGTVNAQGGERGAGIGGGHESNGGTVVINGGTIVARGGKYGAGIGGGQDGCGANVTVNDGHVDAYGGVDAAGIGTGEEYSYSDIHGGKLTVNGGYVYAVGNDWGAGIGGGEDAKGAEVVINGGTVIALAGKEAGEKNGSAIGSEDGDGRRGSLTIADKMMVYAGQSLDDADGHLFSSGERVAACIYRPCCKVMICNHMGSTYTFYDDQTHTFRCPHCLIREQEPHATVETDVNLYCTKCGGNINSWQVAFYLPDKSSEKLYYENSFRVIKGSEIELPYPPTGSEPYQMQFYAWLEDTQARSPEQMGITNHLWQDSESNDSRDPLCKYKVTHDVSFIARYKLADIILADDGDNWRTLYKNNKKYSPKVILQGRKLYKDGTWNTLCLPFDVKITESPLAGDDVVARTLGSSSYENGTLKINFTAAPETITAGTPFLIKWNKSETNLENPEFEKVTINNNLQDTPTDYITFIGTFSPDGIYEEGAKTKLYLGSDNKLRYPKKEGYKVNSCRGYFQLKGGHLSNNITTEDLALAHEFIINFGEDETTGISEVNANAARPASKEVWYTPDGRRLDRRPATKGIYINNGRKIVIP